MRICDGRVFQLNPVLMSPMRLLLGATPSCVLRADSGDAPGTRLSSRAELMGGIADAGFVRSRVADEDSIVHGIALRGRFSVPLVAVAPAEVPSPDAVAR
jgi:hypothetical protein